MKMIPLDIPVPPQVEDAFGYAPAHMERYVGFYWIPGGDEFMFSDGYLTTSGCWQGFQVFAHHPSIRPHLEPFNFGDSDREAEHYLLLDREARKFYVVSADEAPDFLAKHSREDDHPVLSLSVNAQRQYAEMIIDAMYNTPAPSVAQIAQRLAETNSKVQRLRLWLDSQS